ncbi:MAG: hypothetical protein V1921_03420 [Candidatus Altiarchaeota archaeon]
MIPTQKTRSKPRVMEKEPAEKELHDELILQEIKPMSPVDALETEKKLKPTSEFYASNRKQRISADGSDDSDSDDDGKSQKKTVSGDEKG